MQSDLNIPALEAEWLALHPGYNITRGGAQAAIGQAFATAAGLHAAHLLVVRTTAGRLAGVLSYLSPLQYPNEHDSYHISWLGVEEDLQNQGFAHSLMHSLAHIAAKDHKPLTIAPASSQSKQFFVNLGFSYSGWGYSFGRQHERHYQLSSGKVIDFAQTEITQLSLPAL